MKTPDQGQSDVFSMSNLLSACSAHSTFVVWKFEHIFVSCVEFYGNYVGITTFCFHKKSEVHARRCSVKKVFLEIWQNSQENTCAKVCALDLQLY